MSSAAKVMSSRVLKEPSFSLVTTSAVISPVGAAEPFVASLTSEIRMSRAPSWASKRTPPLKDVAVPWVLMSYVPVPSTKAKTPLFAACSAPPWTVILPCAKGIAR